MFCMGLTLAHMAALAQPAPHLDPAQFQSAPPADEALPDLGLKASIGVETFDMRSAAPATAHTALRAALDFRHDWRVGDQMRLTLSDRLDWLLDANGHGTVRHVLREAFVSVGMQDTWFVDAGRINVRSGVGIGFNPTDWLREGAAVPQTSQNPATQRENRLGTVMLKVQTLQDWGAAHMALIPKLADPPDTVSPYGLDWGRTNADPALHLRVAPRLSERISVDALAYARAGRQPQWGLNTTAVLSDAWLAHLEWATGRRDGLAAPGQARIAAPQHRVATGLSWTATSGAVMSIERHLATDALGAGDWDAWRLASDAATARQVGRLRAERLAAQDPLVRDAWFVRLTMNEMLRDPDIDASAFLRINPHDRSRLWQADASWHVSGRWSLIASLGGFAGDARSELGANPLRRFALLRAEMAI